MGYGRKLLHALLGASLTITVLTVATTARADSPLPGNKPCATVAPQAGATKVLLAGDSIVHESRGDWTWRYFLDKQLRAAGVNFDFVGDYNWMVDANRGNWPFCDYQDPNFDTDFTASPGTRLLDFNEVGQTPGGVPWIRYEMQTWQADVLVMLAGANDLAKGATAAGTLAEAQELVANARAVNPNVKIVLVATPTGGPYDNKPNAAYNTQLKDAAPGWSQPNSPVVVTDPMTQWGTAVHTWDFIHPNVVGEQLIARGIADALHSIGIGLAGLDVNPAYKIGLPQPVTNVVATLDGSEVDLTWTLPVGASGSQVMARDTTSGTPGAWTMIKDLWWEPLNSSRGCTNPDYNPNPFSSTYDPNQTIPCTSTTITEGLIPGHTYDLALRSSKGQSVAVDVFSNLQSVTIPAIPPPATPVLNAPTAGVNSVSLSWAAAAGANQPYNVRWRVAGSDSYVTSTASGTTKTVTGLVAGQSYGFQVQANKSGVTSDWSAEQLATPRLAVPGVNATAGVGSVSLSWAAVTDANQPYNVRWRVAGSGDYETATASGTSTTVPGLAPGQAYGFQVQAVNAGTSSDWSAEKVATPKPGVPTISTANPGPHSAALSWSTIAGAVDYRVGWRIGSGAWTFSGFAAGTSRTITGLRPGVTYDFRVQARAGTTSGDYSASKFATPRPYVMAAPAKPVLKQVAGPKVASTWRAVAGANRYRVQIRLVGGGWKDVRYVTATRATSAKVLRKKKYEFRVIPYDGTFAGRASAAARITVK